MKLAHDDKRLVITADEDERKMLECIRDMYYEASCLDMEQDAVEALIANSELDWVQPEDVGALTSAPMLGIRDESGSVTAAWAYMDYEVRSFVDDLIDKGSTVFVSGA